MSAPSTCAVLNYLLHGRLKALYCECREKLTATGAGLVDEDRESEFEPGSQLANIWGECLSTSHTVSA